MDGAWIDALPMLGTSVLCDPKTMCTYLAAPMCKVCKLLKHNDIEMPLLGYVDEQRCTMGTTHVHRRNTDKLYL